jgi:hypothetical protein
MSGFHPLQTFEQRLPQLWRVLSNALSPQFAEVVRRDLPMTHRLFSSMGELKSVTFRGRGAMGDDVYDLVFARAG